MKKYAVIYLDLLGFKSFLKEDFAATLAILQDFHDVLNINLLREKIQPHSKMPEGEFKRLAVRHAADSFEYFLPMSDSIVILSEDPDKVAAQLSTFLCDSFLCSGHAFAHPDSSNVHQQSIQEARTNEFGEEEINRFQENWYPVLFRGGISYGDVKIVQTPAICDGKVTTVSNVIGPGVVQAVSLEQSRLSGPRILCDREFVDQIREPVTKYFRQEDDAWELLWPSFKYLEGSDEMSESYTSTELFGSALALWRHFSGKSPERHYRAFLELVVRSHLVFAETASEPKLVNDHLETKIKEAGIKVCGSGRNTKLVFPEDGCAREQEN